MNLIKDWSLFPLQASDHKPHAAVCRPPALSPIRLSPIHPRSAPWPDPTPLPAPQKSGLFTLRGGKKTGVQTPASSPRAQHSLRRVAGLPGGALVARGDHL